MGGSGFRSECRSEICCREQFHHQSRHPEVRRITRPLNLEQTMIHAIIKFSVSAAILVGVSEIAKRSSLLGGLLASLPLTSLLALIWLWQDTRDPVKVAALSTSILWLVLPSLVCSSCCPACLSAA